MYEATTNSVKYAWIERHKNRWPVTLQCEVLNVSTSGYFEQQRRKDSDQAAVSDKRLNDAALLVHIRAVHAASKGEWLATGLAGTACQWRAGVERAGQAAHEAARHQSARQTQIRRHHRQQTQSAYRAEPAQSQLPARCAQLSMDE